MVPICRFNALAAPICRALEHACPELPEHFGAFESEDFCGLPFIAMELHVEAAIIKQITEWVEWQLAHVCRVTDSEVGTFVPTVILLFCC